MFQQQQQESPIAPDRSTPTNIYGDNCYMTACTIRFNQSDYDPEKFGKISLEDINSLLLHKRFTEGQNRRVQFYEGVLFLERRGAERDNALCAISVLMKTTRNIAKKHFDAHVEFLKKSPEEQLAAISKKPGRKSSVGTSIIAELKKL